MIQVIIIFFICLSSNGQTGKSEDMTGVLDLSSARVVVFENTGLGGSFNNLLSDSTTVIVRLSNSFLSVEKGAKVFSGNMELLLNNVND